MRRSPTADGWFVPLSSLAHEITQGALTWLPIAFFAILVFLIWRTIQLMPRVKPNLTEPNSTTSVSFADVAGVEEAKAELQEVVDFLRDPERFARLGARVPKGLLLYGPPGTGKTHTTRYLLGRMTDYTRLVLTGRALVAVGSVAALARDLHPAVVVLEDVDLVAEDRSFGPAASPVLFDLLDAMDGGAPDADLLFLLTTNRADLLEPALAARPGRVDVAVEISLPDATGRQRLLDLYGRQVPLTLTDDETAAAVERTEGVTASFLKELVRRSLLEALAEADTDPGSSAGRSAAVEQPVVTGSTSRAPSTTSSTPRRQSPGPCSVSAASPPPWLRAPRPFPALPAGCPTAVDGCRAGTRDHAAELASAPGTSTTPAPSAVSGSGPP